jgi:hypothetical protein
MTTKPAKPRDRETLLATIRTAVAANPDQPLTFQKFLTTTKTNANDVFRHFSRWNEALRAAGFTFRSSNAPVTDHEMLADWGRLARKLKRLPTHLEYKIQGTFSTTTFIRRFGGWSKASDAFRNFASRTRSSQWNDVLKLLPSRNAPDRAYRRRKQIPPVQRHRRITRPDGTRGRFSDRPVCGSPLDLGGLRYAPSNEGGVIFLFGEMAKPLGFLVESIQTRFPDCEAKRQVAPGEWQTVRIEFEYESRNFRDHGHDPEGCDMIVCWNHNWPECPINIEVIALNDEIKRLNATNEASLGRA